MAKVYERIDAQLRDWIERQALFFVGTAPIAGEGHINVSPKGPIGSLRILDDHTVAYLDVFGSGAETIAHLRENGRIVVMLCAFEGPPRILRLHGRGEVVMPDEERFGELLGAASFEDPGIEESRRAIVVVAVKRVADSCGYGVPLMSYERARPHLTASAEKKLRVRGPRAFEEYRTGKNAVSIDGLPALDAAPLGDER
jgi:hypothetical protein